MSLAGRARGAACAPVPHPRVQLCVLVAFLKNNFRPFCVLVCRKATTSLCVCVCVQAKPPLRLSTHTCAHTHMRTHTRLPTSQLRLQRFSVYLIAVNNYEFQFGQQLVNSGNELLWDGDGRKPRSRWRGAAAVWRAAGALGQRDLGAAQSVCESSQCFFFFSPSS